MKKQLLVLTAAIVLIAGCQNQKVEVPQKEIKINLTAAELKEANNNADNIKLLLMKKSILKEMAAAEYSVKEKEELNQLKENMEIEYFLNKKATEMVTITDNDILKIYQNNIDKLKDMDINEVLVQIKNNIMTNEIHSKKLEYLNSLAAKYELDKKVNEYITNSNNQAPKIETEKVSDEKNIPADKNPQ